MNTVDDSTEGLSPWAKFVGRVYTVDSLAKAMGVDDFKVAELEAKGKLLSLETSDEHLIFPEFQFQKDMTVYPDLLTVWNMLKKGNVSTWTQLGWLLAPFRSPGDPSFLELLQRGEKIKEIKLEAKYTVARWLR